MDPDPRAAPTAIRAQDRTVRVLVSLADDLIVGHDEGGLLRTTLDHVVTTLGLTGGATYLLSEDEGLVIAAGQEGKWKTALQLVGIIALCVHYRHEIDLWLWQGPVNFNTV